MSLDFQVEKRKNNFVIHTGLPISVLTTDYPSEASYLSAYRVENEYLVPRNQLCNVLDRCFDHFTEESLIHITRLLDKNDDELRDRIQEQSVSKRKQKTKYEFRHDRQEQLPRPQEATLRHERQDVPQEKRQDVPQEKLRQDVPQEKLRQDVPQEKLRQDVSVPQDKPRQDEVRHRSERHKEHSNFDEEGFKTKSDLLKMFYQIKSQMDQMERYLLSLK